MARSWSRPLRRPDYSSFNAQPSIDGGGDDTLIGGQRVQGNYLIGDAQEMSINARGGNDTLISGTAGFFNTPLIGEASLVSGSVRCGNDTLISGPSNTSMAFWSPPTDSTGLVATGRDTFVFGPHNGNDTIGDFHQFDHHKIGVSPYGVTKMSQMTFTTDGTNTKIACDASNSLTLKGIGDPSVLGASQLIFVKSSSV
jgi:hypothetical protein